MGALPLLGYAPWGRTSLEAVIFFVVVYSAIHVLVALLVMLVTRKWLEYFPAIMLGVLLGGLAALQAGTAMRMKAYELAVAVLAQCESGEARYGAITRLEELRANLVANCLPDNLAAYEPEQFDEFLAERRRLMAQKIKQYYWGL